MTRIVLETERLLLREFDQEDAPAFLEMVNITEALPYMEGRSLASVEEARRSIEERPLSDYRKHGFGRWAVVAKADSRLIGFCGLKYLDDLGEVDVGYRLLPEYWGRGLATEAAVPSIRYGFEVAGLRQIIGLVHPENARSIRVLVKCGLSFDRLMDYQSLPTARYVIDAPQVS